MKKTLITFFTLLWCLTSSVVWSKSEFNIVEIKLINNLDDKRGFCIDIKGHKSRAKIEREDFKHIPVTLIKEKLL